MYHNMRLTAQKIARRLELIGPLAYRRRHPLAPFRFKALGGPLDAPPLDPTLDDSDWPVIPPQTYWGAHDVNFVLRSRFAVPSDFDPDSPMALFFPLGDTDDFSLPEALVYLDGTLYAATDRHHQECPLPAAYCDGQPHTVVLHGWTGLTSELARKPDGYLVMGACAVIQIDPPTREFLAAARTALQAAHYLNDAEPAKTRLYNALDEAFKLLDTREPLGGGAFYASVPAALDTLRAGIARAGAPLDLEVIAAGHAHIDVAWLWTLGQTRQKAARTFSTALRLMEQFPDYHFTQSQPQLYAYVQHDYPAVFEGIRQRVAEGRWEPIGGMWVEADCNITGPESLVRQLVLGRAYFRQQFGPDAESPVLWLPDVFGYAWNLPQLIKQAGMDYFFTIKIGWNQVNKLPYDSFWWQGLDGTQVLTHFSTTPEIPGPGGDPSLQNSATYNANLCAFTALGTWTRLKHKEAQRTMLMSYGYGDGGGGPTREMNENAQELRAFPALPRVRQGKVIDFFRRLEAESGDQLPTWNSELYLEIHRGTYTTQSRNKRANRKSEFLLHDAEFLAALAALHDPTYVYPHDTFRQVWQLVCLNQFHDIIPGSSINAVYVESQQQYAEIRALAEAARETALAVVTRKVGGDVVIVNPTGFERSDLALWPNEFPAGQCFAGDVYTQRVEDGVLIAAGPVEPYSVKPLTFAPGTSPQPDPAVYPLRAEPGLLENAYVRVELDGAGDIVRIYDKTVGRDVLPPHTVANQFQAFEDRPINWDAWDIDIFYDDKLFLAEPAQSIRVVESGPLRATIEITRYILNSRTIQRISLAYNSPRIDFDTVIDWRERHILLKTAFPVDVLAPVATYEIQWGSVQRPTHRNTSWDWARFETCAQKWVDLSEGGYGAALLNDCKYGHDIHRNVIRLSLLRGSTMPDPEADQGEHRFAYSLYPHANPGGGTVIPADIAQQAYALNDPLLVISSSRAAPAPVLAPLVMLPPHTIIETIKQAEDGNGIIVRFYECNRQRGPIMLRAGFALQAAYLTNLLEEDHEALPFEGQRVELYVRPFQVVTVRLVPA